MPASLKSKLFLIFFLFPFCTEAGPKIENWTTDNGARVYFVRAEGLPLIDLKIVFDAGSARDGQQFGVASLTAALLDSGTKEWNADTIAERLDQVGAQLSSGASRDSSSLSLRCLTTDNILDSALETLTKVINSPSFNQKDFEREKQRLLVGLRQREESPASLASIAFYKALYGEHPYAHPISGLIETVEPLTRDDLEAFYRRYYLANNAIIAIVGDVSRQQAKSIAQSLMRDLPTGDSVASIPKIPEPKKSNVVRRNFPSQQTHIYSGVPVLTRKDKDYVPLYMGNHILGGSGLVSKISEEVREKRGLSYSAYSYFSPLNRKGPFTMGLQTKNDQAEEAFSVLNQTVEDFIKNGPTAEELDNTKKNITGGFVLRYDSNRKLAGYLATIGFYQLPLDYLDSFPKRVLKVSREDIKNAFQRRVRPENFQTIMVGGES